ncbi:MAG: mandelate racemase/muconate lactonizing enzyme family protein [Myxococcaceae bacterium]
MDLSSWELPLLLPVRIGSVETRVRRGLRVKVGAGDLEGIGECAPTPELGTETLEASHARLVEVARDWEQERAPESLERIDQLLDAGVLRDAPAARSAVEMALLDVLGRRSGVPLAKLFDDSPSATVEVSAQLITRDTETAIRLALRAVGLGFQTLKLKVRDSRECERVGAVRNAIGRAFKLRVDANGQWSETEALEHLQAFSRYHVELCEQPVADFATLLRVAAESPVPLAADESAKNALADGPGSIRFVVLKPLVWGGLVRVWRAAQQAKSLGLTVVLTHAFDSPRACEAVAHLASALESNVQSRVAHGVGGWGWSPRASFGVDEAKPHLWTLSSRPGLVDREGARE